MRLRRKRGAGDPVIDFWEWWESARPRLTASISAGDGGMTMVDEISRRAKAIHADLQWELGAGRSARHGFTLSPAGFAPLRAVAARWLALAPPADSTWEFYDARQPNRGFADTTLTFNEKRIALGDTRFAIALKGDPPHSIDVVVFHPTFADLPHDRRRHIGYLCLDWALGEHDVEVWVGGISAATTRPADARTVDELHDVVADVAEQHREPQWVLLGGTGPGGVSISATVQVPLRSARWPRFDTHVLVALPFDDRGNGLPTDAALTALRALEDSVTQMLDRSGELLAHETSGGTRILHYYVDGRSEAAPSVKQAVSSWPGAKCTITYDPALENVRHLAVAG